MSPRTEPIRWSPPPTSGEGSTVLWLDALATGHCSPEEFLGAMRPHFQGDRDEGWEVMSLLDQYYRRGKIKAEIFHALKMRLASSAFEGSESAVADMAARPKANQPPASIAVTAPATPSPVNPPSTAGAAVREVAIGDVLRGRYWVRGLLGHGGMGTVFEAIDEYRLDLPSTSQRIAIKVLHTEVCQREELLAELQREFQHLQLLSHPNIVRVHEFDRDGDIAFFTMELLNGALLSTVLSARASGALPRRYALAIMRDVGAALAHAHSRGVVHGDINPQNIFITNDGELRLLDFGASHKFARQSLAADDKLSQRAPVATAGYASCQVLEGQQPDARDDVFAFACVAYVLLSGRHPFPGRSAAEARAERLHLRRPPRLTGRQWRTLRQGLRWDRERRPASVRQWLGQFDLAGAAPYLPLLPALVDTARLRKRHAVRTAAGIIMFVLLAIGGYWAVTNDDSLTRNVMEWSERGRSAFAGTDASPTTAAPAAMAPQPPSPAITRAGPSAPSSSEPPRKPPRPLSAATGPAVIAQPAPHAASDHPVNPGPTRVEMAADTVDVQSTDTTARVTVRRRGSLNGDTHFMWWTESGTAKPGRDFLAVTPRVERIANGSGSISLNIPILGKAPKQPRSFYVVIDRTDTGAALGRRTLTMVTLQPAD